MGNENKATYYENSDFSELLHKGRKVGKTLKRITLNISNQIYDEANELDTYMNMGYQNVLKTAMTIGLTQLYDQVSRHKIIKTTGKHLNPRQGHGASQSGKLSKIIH